MPGVYAGGDVGRFGPASIVKAAGDGKRMAAAILDRLDRESAPPHEPPSDPVDLLRRRSHREFRIPVRETPLEERRSFEETTHTYSLEEAQAEASRCLDCDQICSICVGVCPNLAILTYASNPLNVQVPVVDVDGDTVEVSASAPYRVDQKLQVAVLTDFCNECGNCATFCPTAGLPYVDKPRLYLDEEDFAAQTDNAFMLLEGSYPAMAGRWGGETHRITLNGNLTYETPAATVHVDPMSWRVTGAAADGAVEGIDLQPAAAMYALLEGLAASAPHLPKVGEEAGTRVAHPGYAE